MPWIQIKASCDVSKVKKVTSMLEGAGAASVTYMDAGDNPVYEPMPGETKLWGNTVVTGLFDAETDAFKIVRFMQKSLGDHASFKVEQLEDRDWVREWMDHFHPMKFGQKLWICPSWCPVPEEAAITVLLDPGLAFGTGTHPTTAMCLEWLDGAELEGKTVIDYGCGSGILAIAAIKLGAARVIGIDIDPQAIQASKDNAERNGVADKLELFLADERPEGLKADTVVANILAGPLRELEPIISSLVKDGGNLALSGILERQSEEVSEAYAQNFQMGETMVKEEWCRLQGVKIVE